MHYEFIVEDISGKTFLEKILPKILNTENNTYHIHSYKGIGRVPRKLNEDAHPRQRLLLTQLPKLLNGLGKTFLGYGENYPACVIIVCDLDAKGHAEFVTELEQILADCHTAPEARFCIAIEEGEAWLLGDLDAVKAAYPNAKEAALNNYVQDSICGTWEILADAIQPGGRLALSSYQEAGKAKFDWANNITPHIEIDRNISPSFQQFVETCAR